MWDGGLNMIAAQIKRPRRELFGLDLFYHNRDKNERPFRQRIAATYCYTVLSFMLDIVNLHPLQLSDYIAQQIYNDPHNNWQEANVIEPLARRYYTRSGLMEHDPERANWLVARTVLRTNVAPILYEVESELESSLWTVLHHHEALPATGDHVPELDQDDLDFIDRIYDGYGEFEPADRAFLQETAVYAYAAFLRFFKQAQIQGSRQCALLRIFGADERGVHQTIANYFRSIGEKVLAVPTNPYSYIASISIGANINALNVLKPAGEHAHLWPEGFASKAWGPIRAHLNELAKPQNMTRHAVEAAFPQQIVGVEPPEHCPFAHGNAAAKAVWRHRLLMSDNLSGRWCAADVPFKHWKKRYLPADTAASKRFKVASYIADRTLYPDTVPAGVGIACALCA
jgi:hypothetical protein